MWPNIGYFSISNYCQETSVLACSCIFQNILQEGDSMSHPGHGDSWTKAAQKCWKCFAVTVAHDLLLATRTQCCSGVTSVGKAELFPLTFLVKWAEVCRAFRGVQPGLSFLLGLHFGNIAAKTTRQLLHMSDSLGRQLSWLWVLHKNQNRCIERWWWKLAHILSFLYMSWQDVAWRNHLCPGSLLLPQSQD